jgi:predicted enzyme related to lactoylglutathione lyase
METVTGIGGVFFRARNPESLSRWYTEHLGVHQPPQTYDDDPWRQEAGPTVFAPMGADSPHFGRDEQQWSLNFRVRDLDAMVAQLRAAGVEVTVHDEEYPNGRFAELADPEGNPIQLWQPAGREAG